VLHLTPSGILREKVQCIIGHGVVIDPVAFTKELEMLKSNGIMLDDRLFVSENAHLILPYHSALDNASETSLTPDKSIGTTGRGIGPAYTDKVRRMGIKVADIKDENNFRDKLYTNLLYSNKLLKHIYNVPELNIEQIIEDAVATSKSLIPYIANTTHIIHNAITSNKNILLEGAQGTMLDVDYGTYPFVTSSNSTSGGACTGSSIPPNKINRIIGLSKAYCTRVGNGPFPTEQNNEIGKILAQRGFEFGATTGRLRRCG
jgi:adenylosuccinate synthase